MSQHTYMAIRGRRGLAANAFIAALMLMTVGHGPAQASQSADCQAGVDPGCVTAVTLPCSVFFLHCILTTVVRSAAS